MYCSRCNGLLLEGFLQIVMYGKSLKQEGAGGQLSCNRSKVSKSQKDGTSITNGCHDEIPDPSVHPWGGLTITREGSLTLMDCYLYCKSLKGLQNVSSINFFIHEIKVLSIFIQVADVLFESGV